MKYLIKNTGSRFIHVYPRIPAFTVRIAGCLDRFCNELKNLV
jgi:hypothetical protein